jgi:hypothetical protein
MVPPPKPTLKGSSPFTSDTMAAWGKITNTTVITSHPAKIHSCQTRSISSLVSLRFNPQVRVRYVPSLDDLTPQEHLDTWYSNEDYKIIRRREHRLMKELSRPKLNDREISRYPVSLTQRVLGLQTSKEHDARCQLIREAQVLVLNEQERYGDAERLARIYYQISSESAQQARNRGLNVEIVLRNLELCSDSSHHRGRPECLDGPPNASISDMRYRRWYADASSSPSLSPVRDTTICPVVVVERPAFAIDPMLDLDVPLSITMKHHFQRRHAKNEHNSPSDNLAYQSILEFKTSSPQF